MWQVIELFYRVVSSNAATGTGAESDARSSMVPWLGRVLVFLERKAMLFYGQNPGSLSCLHASTHTLGYLIWATSPTSE